MKKINHAGERLKIFIPLFNAGVLALYLIDYDLISKLPFKLIVVCLCFCIVAVVTVKSSNRIIQYLQDAQLTLFSIILLFLFFEGVARFYPKVFPLQIRNYLSEGNINDKRQMVVEYLEESPFVKFKPHVIVRSQGYRGTDKQFVYEWKTDSLGFKNPEGAAKAHVEIVALGDSFTEGMGVITDNIWPTLLTKAGYPTYNLAVQGYAPKQMEGSLREYGLQFHPKYIIIGYCRGTFTREKNFIDEEDALKGRRFAGGIQDIITNELRGEIRMQARHFISAIYLLGCRTMWDLRLNGLASLRMRTRQEIKIEAIRPYAPEILDIENGSYGGEQIKLRPREWESMLRAFHNIMMMAKAVQAKAILVYLPDRASMYYEKATGKELPANSLKTIEGELLQEFSRKNNIVFLNPSERIMKYINDLPNNAPIQSYPYLEIDAHLSEQGHALVAEEILEYLSSER